MPYSFFWLLGRPPNQPEFSRLIQAGLSLELGKVLFLFLRFVFLSFAANPGPGSPVGWEGFGDFGKAGNYFLKDKIQTQKKWSWHTLRAGNKQFFFFLKGH